MNKGNNQIKKLADSIDRRLDPMDVHLLPPDAVYNAEVSFTFYRLSYLDVLALIRTISEIPREFFYGVAIDSEVYLCNPDKPRILGQWSKVKPGPELADWVSAVIRCYFALISREDAETIEAEISRAPYLVYHSVDRNPIKYFYPRRVDHKEFLEWQKQRS